MCLLYTLRFWDWQLVFLSMQDRRDAVKEAREGAGEGTDGAGESPETALGTHRGSTRRTQMQQERKASFCS